MRDYWIYSDIVTAPLAEHYALENFEAPEDEDIHLHLVADTRLPPGRVFVLFQQHDPKINLVDAFGLCTLDG